MRLGPVMISEGATVLERPCSLTYTLNLKVRIICFVVSTYRKRSERLSRADESVGLEIGEDSSDAIVTSMN